MIIFKFHILYWLMALICALTGYFKNFILFSALIIIHELGHFFGAFIYKWKVKKIVILPIGGITIFNENLSKSIFEEFIILILGPLFQIIFYFIYTKIFGFNQILSLYNFILLFFNMLPIYPLDGYKLISLALHKFFSFKFSHILSIIISIITIFLCFIFFKKTNFILLLALIFLIIKNISEFINHDIIFNKFLLERYLYNINLKKTKIINSKNYKKMKREYKHIFHYEKKYETEKSFLKKKFDNKHNLC